MMHSDAFKREFKDRSPTINMCNVTNQPNPLLN